MGRPGSDAARWSKTPIPGTLTLDGVRSILAGKVERWVQEWKAQGPEEGRAEGAVVLIRQLLTTGRLSQNEAIAEIRSLATAGTLSTAAAETALAALQTAP